MPDIFKEIVPSILQTKKNVFGDDPDYKDYNPFIVNRALSFHPDCIPYVEEMNELHHLDKDMQYQYLINTIRPMKRKFASWQKAQVEKDLECVKEYFGYSNQKAKEAMRILTNEQIIEIKRRIDKGGVKNG